MFFYVILYTTFITKYIFTIYSYAVMYIASYTSDERMLKDIQKLATKTFHLYEIWQTLGEQ